MKILIVGGTSSVAQAVIPSLSKMGSVTTAGRQECDFFLDLSANEITLPGSFNVVVHLASHFGGKTHEDFIQAMHVNVTGTLKLARAAINSGAEHFVFISSIYSRMSADSPYYSVYALSKKLAEESLLYFSEKHAMPLTILQPSPLYGDQDIFRRHQPFFYSLADKAEKSEAITLYGKNDAKRNFLHVDDLARVMTEVITRKVTGVFQCQFPEQTSLSRIASAAVSAFSSSSTVAFLKDKDDVMDNVYPFDNTLYQRIAFTPAITVEQGMKRIAAKRMKTT